MGTYFREARQRTLPLTPVLIISPSRDAPPFCPGRCEIYGGGSTAAIAGAAAAVAAAVNALLLTRLSLCLQFRCGEWRGRGPQSSGRRGLLALRRPRPAEPAPAEGVVPLPLRLGLRNVAQVDVEKLVHRQREVSFLIPMPMCRDSLLLGAAPSENREVLSQSSCVSFGRMSSSCSPSVMTCYVHQSDVIFIITVHYSDGLGDFETSCISICIWLSVP